MGTNATNYLANESAIFLSGHQHLSLYWTWNCFWTFFLSLTFCVWCVILVVGFRGPLGYLRLWREMKKRACALFLLPYPLCRLACRCPGGNVRKMDVSGPMWSANLSDLEWQTPLWQIPSNVGGTLGYINSLKLSKTQVGSQDKELAFKTGNALTILVD